MRVRLELDLDTQCGVAVLFLASNVAFLVAVIERKWLLALGAVVLTFLALAVQGLGHRAEPTAPEPCASPRNAIARIFLEQ
ncbi:MAG TPA: hypothetical protein VIY50_03605 [Steroidobacteraceae bacterium]